MYQEQAMNQEQMKRYREQISVPGMNAEAQVRLLSGKAILLGANDQTVAICRSLLAVGLGEVTVLDESKGALKKVSQALATEIEEDTDTRFVPLVDEFSPASIEAYIPNFDVVADSTDDWQHKLLFSDICMAQNKPLVHAGVIGFRCQVYAMLPGKSACLRCALIEIGIDEVPIEPPAVGGFKPVSELIGAWQAVEIIKLIGRLGATQGNELFKLDCLSGEFEVIRGLDPAKDCPDCGPRYFS
jgi:adenylyltransferase/sulfurtransferase